MYQDCLKKETIEFLKQYVYPFSDFKEITNENADDIVDFILLQYVCPLVEDEEELGLEIDHKLLKSADDAIDDICEN